MGKWLERAKREISEQADRPTANTDVRSLSAVLAVPHSDDFEKIEASNGSSPPADFRKFESLRGDDELARIIANTAKAHGLDPLALRGWCDPPTLDAIRSGDPAELVAFAAGVASAVRCGELCPADGGEHGFSSHAKAADAHPGPVCCGDCGHFEPDAIGDGRGIGRCLAGVPPRPGVPARYPRAERYCRVFCVKEAGRNGASLA